MKSLSICIPTYNRCEILDNTLQSLLFSPEFDANRIEVIVSDNCSSDNTESIVAKYPVVKYYRNEENIRDLNFSMALGYSTGKYIRLFNDTLSFKPNALTLMLRYIENESNSTKNLFFYDNMFLNKNCQKEVSSIDSYVNEVSYLSTWIANFGAWREDFLNILEKDKYAPFQFTQVDWCYQIVRNSKPTIIYFNEFFEVATPDKKGGYNIFNTFINYYLFIIKQQKLSFFVYEREKYRLFRYFVYPWLIKLFIMERTAFNFDVRGAFKIILKKYWYEPYCYMILLLFWLRKFKNKRDGR